MNQERANFHKLQESYNHDESASFITKIFFVRYADEKVLLRDLIKFRTEIDVS